MESVLTDSRAGVPAQRAAILMHIENTLLNAKSKEPTCTDKVIDHVRGLKNKYLTLSKNMFIVNYLEEFVFNSKILYFKFITSIKKVDYVCLYFILFYFI